MAIFLSGSEKATVSFAKEYAKTLRAGDVVLLYGDMGAGKTVFVKGVAKGLGIKDEILSPTYAYMNDYDGKLYHYDCYRLTSGAQAEGLGLTDYFHGDGVCLIEWAENIADALPENCKSVTIKKISASNREIICE
ncbi:MAG: tRNA (adenosine(37)-N6)-threonylcarbamoyltransferase complex ATPase subunit type 1 TsaE [Clostridiales bacterium]|nr:tRNA (adenosine(37)-N6)-threonylcarbamoyltransferase complex ATPase subunit type 1 TsaE [Clostridiales bacterium]